MNDEYLDGCNCGSCRRDRRQRGIINLATMVAVFIAASLVMEVCR